MKRSWLIALVFLVFILLNPLLFRKRSIALVAGGKTIAVAKRGLVVPWADDAEIKVFAGREMVFGLWTDMLDGPLYVYPFPDGKKFLCDFDDDTAILTFVVDLSGLDADDSNPYNWPWDYEARRYLAQRMTNVVLDTKGVVRLPTLAELQEAGSQVAALDARQFQAVAFPRWDLGFVRSYPAKEFVLSNLATNRRAVW